MKHSNMRSARRLVALAAAGLLGLALAITPTLSANASWHSYGYASCSYPTTMSTSPGYTWHQIHDSGGWFFAEDYGSAALKFHSLGLDSGYASEADIEVYNETYVWWGCAGSGYRYTGW